MQRETKPLKVFKVKYSVTISKDSYYIPSIPKS